MTPEFPGERRNHCRRHAGRKATPSGMRAGHRTGAGVGEEQRNAVGRLDGQGERVIAGHDDVGLRAAATDIFRDHNLGPWTCGLEQRAALTRMPSHFSQGRIIATRRRRTQRPASRGKDVGRQRGEGTADERRSGRGLHPIECLARLRKV